MNFIPYVIVFIIAFVFGAGVQAYCDEHVINELKQINYDSLEKWRESNNDLIREFDRMLTELEKELENRRDRV